MGEESYPDPPAEVEGVEPAELQRRLDAGETWRIDGPAVTRTHLPYAKFMAASVRDEVGELARDVAGEGPITVVCGRGEASDYVAGLLVEAGIDAHNLAGGMDGWGRLYEAHTVTADPLVVQYRRPATGCLSYLIVSAGEALVVDPLLAFVDRYRADAADRGAEIVAVFDTHLHADHLSGLRELTPDDRDDGRDVRRLVPAGIARRNLAFDAETVTGGESTRVGDVGAETVPLPGHTTEMTGLRVGDVLLAGDSVFVDSVARPDLQEGVDHRDLARDLYETLTDRLDGLGDPLVAPGHHREETEPAADGTYTARLSTIRERVPAFGLDEPEFVEQVLADAPRPANVERILAINRGEAAVGADEAFELELGPNNCAAAPVAGE